MCQVDVQLWNSACSVTDYEILGNLCKKLWDSMLHSTKVNSILTPPWPCPSKHSVQHQMLVQRQARWPQCWWWQATGSGWQWKPARVLPWCLTRLSGQACSKYQAWISSLATLSPSIYDHCNQLTRQQWFNKGANAPQTIHCKSLKCRKLKFNWTPPAWPMQA